MRTQQNTVKLQEGNEARKPACRLHLVCLCNFLPFPPPFLHCSSSHDICTHEMFAQEHRVTTRVLAKLLCGWLFAHWKLLNLLWGICVLVEYFLHIGGHTILRGSVGLWASSHCMYTSTVCYASCHLAPLCHLGPWHFAFLASSEPQLCSFN